MDVVTVSPQFEIALPPRARSALGLAPGQPVQVLVDGGRLDLIPLPPLSALRGILAGIDTHVVRERDRV
ncbi:MAG TPA: AbrB/MazE/SpoVT family DNA-binding domain-containing protein [Gemmatimonadaceae bacterium]